MHILQVGPVFKQYIMIEQLTPNNFAIIKQQAAKAILNPDNLCLKNLPENFAANFRQGVFLMPLVMNWRKEIDASTYLESNTYSKDRRSKMRRNIVKAEKLGIEVNVINPINKESFKRFYDYYLSHTEERGFEQVMESDYLERNISENRIILECVDKSGAYYGGRLLIKKVTNLECAFRAVDLKIIHGDGGVDSVLEANFFNLAAKLAYKSISRGSDNNLRGVNGFRVGAFIGKLQYGYRPYISEIKSIRYLDFKSLKELDFDLIAFFSYEPDENGKAILVFNFWEGREGSMKMDDWTMMIKSNIPVRKWNRNFELISKA